MKSMKKSMFVTTILMVVLLIVALSTATFAWYTSQSFVNVTDTTVVSATASAASLAIDVSPNYSSTKTSIDVTMGANNGPMIPNAAPTATGTPTTYSDFIATFYQSPIDVESKFTLAGQSTAPTTIDALDTDSTKKTIYVINTSGTSNANINVNVSFKTTGYTALTSQPNDWATNYANYFSDTSGTHVTGASAPNFAGATYYVNNDKIVADLRVAIFCDDNYIGTWATTAGAAVATYGTITAGTVYSTINTGFTTYASAQTFKTGLTPRTAATCKIVAWFDGPGLETNEAGMPALFSISFNMV